MSVRLESGLDVQSPSPDELLVRAGLCHESGRFFQAIAGFRAAVRLNPALADAWNNLGAAQLAAGDVSDSVESFAAAAALEPRHPAIISNFLFASAFDWAADGGTIAALHCALAPASYAGGGRPFAGGKRRRRTGPMRVGYLSPGFGVHAVSQFCAPPPHDPAKVEVFAYTTNAVPSPPFPHRRTRRAAHWFDISNLSGDDAAALIRSHELDVLVDRGGYCQENRVDLMARRLAPVQVATADYPATLGMPAVSFRLTDAYLDPPGSESNYVERLGWLPAALCYSPPRRAPRVSALPARRNGFVTFGAFHRLFKLSPDVLEAYAAVLRRLPGSRLLFHHAYGPGPRVSREMKERVEATIERHGVSRRRLRWSGALPHLRSMALYQEVDLALDAHPCAGVTTTAEALYMGVPVTTWYSAQPRSRYGLSMLSAIGLGELATASAEAFIDKSVELAADWRRLASLRRGLRARMRSSLLCDAEAYLRSLEAAYRAMMRLTR